MALNFEQQLAAEYPALRRAAFKITGSPDDAEDVVQTACERALKNRGQFDGRNLKSWMYVLIRNVHVDLCRRSYRRLPHGSVDDVVLSKDADQHEGLVMRDLDRAIAALTPLHRKIMTDVADGASYEEAASATGLTVSNLKSTLSRTRHRVLKQVEGNRW